MRNLVLASLLVPMLGICTVAMGHTEDNPLVVNLIAGQDEVIGEVCVWNDADNIYVEFVSTEVLLKTHVHIATSLEDIPQKNGNAIPGQFQYSKYYPELPNFVIPLNGDGHSWSPCDELFIAAHAGTGTEECITIVSGDGQTMVTQRRSGNELGFTSVNSVAVPAWEPDGSYPNDGANDSGWEANSLWDGGLSFDLRPSGADWIWESYRVSDPILGTALTFERSFDIGYPIWGNLKIACDNGYEVFLNGTSLGSDNVYGNWRTSDLKQTYVDVSGWDTVASYPLLADLLEGTNKLTIDAANEYFNTDDTGNPYPGTASSNPGGLIFAMDICYYATGDTAWGDGESFPGKNWATYFTYTIQCPEPLVENGGFEYPITPTTTPTWGIYDSGTLGLGWTVEWYDSYTGAPDPAKLELHRSGLIVPSSEGNQYAELDTDWQGPGGSSGEQASVVISQEICTCPGQCYQVSYDWAQRLNSGILHGSIDVIFAGHTEHHGSDEISGSTQPDWTTSSFIVEADDYSETLIIEENGIANSLGMLLDNVSVVPVDCP